MEQNRAEACCSPNSVWHWPFYFLLVASCPGSAKYHPSTCSLCKAHDVVYLYTTIWAWELTVPAPDKGISDRTQQKKMQGVFVLFSLIFTGMFASIAVLFLLQRQCLQIHFVLTSFGLKIILKIWSVVAKGKGVSFLARQGLTADKSTSSACQG